MPRVLEREPKLERYLVRWGESLDDIAAFRGVARWTLQALNGLRSGEAVRPGTLLFVPAAAATGAAPAEGPAGAEGSSAPFGGWGSGSPDGALRPPPRPMITVPAQRFAYDDRRRVFYRVVPGDTLRDVAAVLGAGEGDLCRWNALDPGAALHDGMTLQAFVPKARRYDGVLLLDEANARVLEVGSDEFFAHFEGLKGRKRLEIAAREGDDWRKLSRRYGLTLGMLERINHRSRRSPLQPGEKVVVYVPVGSAVEPAPAAAPREPEVAVAAASPEGADAPAGSPDPDPIAEDEEDAVKPAVFRSVLPAEGDTAVRGGGQEPAPAEPPPAGKERAAEAAPPGAAKAGVAKEGAAKEGAAKAEPPPAPDRAPDKPRR
jgi:membrane-bound lytic murein transglycosylase D